MLNNIRTRTELARLTEAQEHAVSAYRLGRLERDDSSPTVDEVNSICEVLNMSADWWLRDNTASVDAITRRVEALSQTERNLIMMILNFAK